MNGCAVLTCMQGHDLSRYKQRSCQLRQYIMGLCCRFVAGMQQYVLHRTADWLSSRHGPIVIPLPAVNTHFIAAARGLIIHGNSHSVWKTAIYLSLLRYHYHINNAVQIKGTVQRIKEDSDRQKKDNLSSCKTH